MDGAGDDVLGWLADGVAAGVLGAAVGTCLLLLGHPGAGVTAAALAVLLALAALRQVKPEPRRFRLPAFAMIDLSPEPALDVLELTDVAPGEVLLLEDRLEEPEASSRVVQLFAARPLPTPGELRQRIEAHLTTPRPRQESDNVLELELDAAAALRQALGELRRSLA